MELNNETLTKFDIIAVTDKNNFVGNIDLNTAKTTIPWDIDYSQLYFETRTNSMKFPNKKNIIIMGKNTWENKIYNFQQSDNTNYIILTSSNYIPIDDLNQIIIIKKSLEEAMLYCDTLNNINKVFIIGGNYLFKVALESKRLQYIYVNKLNKTYDCNLEFPYDFSNYVIMKTSKTICHDNKLNEDIDCLFIKYQKKEIHPISLYHKAHEEEQYIELLRNAININNKLSNTINSDNITIFTTNFQFHLSSLFPLFTLRFVDFEKIKQQVIDLIHSNDFLEKFSKMKNLLKGAPYENDLIINLDDGKRYINLQFFMEALENINYLSLSVNVSSIHLLEIPELIAYYALLLEIISGYLIVVYPITKINMLTFNFIKIFIEKDNIIKITPLLKTRPRKFPTILITNYGSIKNLQSVKNENIQLGEYKYNM